MDHESQKIRQTISRLRHQKSYSNHPLKDWNTIIYDDSEKAETFRKMLQEIYQTPRSQNFDEAFLQDTEKFVTDHPFLFKYLKDIPKAQETLITPQDIKIATKTLKNSTPGPDGIYNVIWKHLSNHALEYLAKLFSASLLCGYLPQRWKEAHILLFPKQNKNPSDMNSYRPISLTNTISKLLEKIIIQKFSDQIQNSLPDSQAGFRKGIEITDQLLRVLTPIEDLTKNRHHTAIIS